MAIFCSKCGKEHPDDANFCMKCGQPLNATSQAAAQPEPQWEYCEVMYFIESTGNSSRDILFNKTYYFNMEVWAEGIGPQGTFNATKGQNFICRMVTHGNPLTPAFYHPESDNPVDVEAVNKLVNYLTKEGWEPLPNKGKAWYSYKFRRRVR